MRYLFKILILTLLISCGNTSHELEMKAPEEDIISGETYSYVIVRLEFIQQMRDICENLYLSSDFATYELYLQQVAQCTLDNLSILNIDAINTFDDEICNNPETIEEQQICDAIN